MTRSSVGFRLGWAAALVALLVGSGILTPPLYAFSRAAIVADGTLTFNLRNAPANTVVAILIDTTKFADATVGADGSAMAQLNLANVTKTRAQVFIRVCKGNRTEMILWTGAGAPPRPQDCNDTSAGFIMLMGGMASYDFTTRALTGPQNFWLSPLGLLILGLAAGIPILFLVLGGDDTGDGGDDNGDGGGGGSGPVAFTAYNGTFRGTATISGGINTCLFAASAAIEAFLNVNTSGVGLWRKTHLSAAVVFEFPNVTLTRIAAGARFTASKQQMIGGANFQIDDEVTLNGVGATATVVVLQRFRRLTGQTCEVLYAMTLTPVQAGM
jgi:hypothetical protein